MDFAHRAVVSAMMLVSAAGLTYIGAGAVEVYQKAQRRKQLKEQEQQAASAQQ